MQRPAWIYLLVHFYTSAAYTGVTQGIACELKVLHTHAGVLVFTLFSLDVTLVSIIQQLHFHFYITNADGFTSCVTVHTS